MCRVNHKPQLSLLHKKLDSSALNVYDHFWMAWNPAEDALKLAVDMQNDDDFPTSPSEIGERYGWPPRRLNPAMAYLINRKLVRDLKAMDSSNWLTVLIQKTDATRRFVKSRS